MAELKFKPIARKNPVTKEVKWYAEKVTYSNIGEREIIDYAVQNSNVERSVIEQAMIGLEEAINNFLINGHNLQFWPLGSFYTTIRSLGAESPGDFNAKNIKRLNIVFVPSPLVKGNASRELVKITRA